MSNPKFRASFSVLTQWAGGNWEQAIKQYFKLEKFLTPQMAEGRDWHEKWAKHIEATKTLPIEFGGKALTVPVAERKTVVQLDDWLELVGVIDCFDKPVVYEWKTGKASSESYAGTKQGGIYAMLATMSGFYTERIEIHHYDQYTKKSDMSIIWVTPELMDDAHNWITTLSAEMHTYFQTNGLYERFGANLLNKPEEINGHE